MDKNLEKELKDSAFEDKHNKAVTILKKKQFIEELKSGLGEEIKKNPNQVKIIKKTFLQKIGLVLKKIFTKF